MRYDSMFRVKPGEKLRLKDIDPDYKGHHETEQDSAASWRKLTKQRNQALSIDVDAATP